MCATVSQTGRCLCCPLKLEWIEAWWLILRYFAELMKSQQRITNMKLETELTDEEKQLMDQYGISCETKLVYLFEGYKYEQLHYALRYAKEVSERGRTPVDVLT